MTHPELNAHVLLAYAAIAVGVAVGIVGASWRGRRQEPKQEPAIEEFDDVGDENIYAAEILPEQVKNHKELVAKIRAKARELASSGREITTDDIHEALPIPDGVDGRILGAAFFPRKDWRKTGYVNSRRRENHSRPIAKWSLRSGEAA